MLQQHFMRSQVVHLLQIIILKVGILYNIPCAFPVTILINKIAHDWILVVGKVNEPLSSADFAHMYEKGGCSIGGEKVSVLGSQFCYKASRDLRVGIRVEKRLTTR